MLRRTVELLGADYHQWRTLTRAFLKMDFRGSAVPGGTPGAAKTAGRSLKLSAFMYLLTGLMFGLMVFAVPTLGMAATLVVTYLIALVGSMVILDHGAVFTSPADFLVLGWRPMTSRTYFLVRLTNILTYTYGLTALAGIFPFLFFLFRDGWQPLAGLSILFAMFLATTCTTLLLVTAYTTVLRLFGGDRVKRALTALQVVAGLIASTWYFMPRLISRFAPTAFDWMDSPWMLIYPPYWFASYVRLAEGQIDLTTLAAAVVTLGATIAMAFGLGRRLSLEYSARLGELQAVPAGKPRAAASRPWLFRSGEARSIALLVRAQFRHDQPFRYQVLSAIPMGAPMLLMTLRRSGVPDPFAARSLGGLFTWLFVPVIVFSVTGIIMSALSRSQAYRASWIYFASPVSRSRLLRATKAVFLVTFLLPSVAAVAALMMLLSGSVAHTLVHFLILGLMALLIAHGQQVSSPQLPFSLDKTTPAGGGNLRVALLTGLFSFFGGFLVGPCLVFLIYPNTTRIAVLIALLVAANVWAHHATRAYIDKFGEKMEFAG